MDEQLKKEIQGAYSQFLAGKNLSARYGQKMMIAEVARCLGGIELDAEGVRTSSGHICVVEAGTGTGKTVAYLLASIPIAKAFDKKVILSTATIALQEQIVHKDLPDVILHSGLEIQYSLAKGRGRYLCLAKLDRLLSESEDNTLVPLYEDEISGITDVEMMDYQEMIGKLAKGQWDGDRDNWPKEIETSTWQRVTTDHRQCSGRKCSHVKNCAFFNAREGLEDVDVIVANHDLVLADLALGGGAILPAPEEAIYIFDEGHHLAGKALNHFSCNTRYRSTVRWLGQSEGQWKGLSEALEDAMYFTQLAADTEEIFNETRKAMEGHTALLEEITVDVDTSNQKFEMPRLRFPHGQVPDALELFAQSLQQKFKKLTAHLLKLYDEVETLMGEDHPPVALADLENIHPLLGTWLGRSEANFALWHSYADTAPKNDWPVARWINLYSVNNPVSTNMGEMNDFMLVSSPILASRSLENDLWSRCAGAVVTSATLTALNSFDRFQYHSGTYDDSVYTRVPSPFKYAENAVFSVPKNAIEANKSSEHTAYIIESLPGLIGKGLGSLMLFSSRRQMNEIYEALDASLRKKILMQGNESKQALIEKHKARVDKNKQSILFGLASFAEGVDLPGEYCTHVIIAKIPFAVPDDPIQASLAEWIKHTGGNDFMELSVPDAAVKLVQASGRLLRTESDTGRVTLLDKRLITKRYGKAILDSLPDFKLEI